MKTTYSWRLRNLPSPNRRLLKNLISDAAALARVPLAEDHVVTLMFVGDRQMAEINWDYLEHEGTTDVITFAYLEEDEIMPGETAVDLVICADFAAREGARRKNSSYSREMVLYAVHGLLHASGEDDLSPEPRCRMRRREREVMAELVKKYDFAEVFPPKQKVTE